MREKGQEQELLGDTKHLAPAARGLPAQKEHLVCFSSSSASASSGVGREPQAPRCTRLRFVLLILISVLSKPIHFLLNTLPQTVNYSLSSQKLLKNGSSEPVQNFKLPPQYQIATFPAGEQSGHAPQHHPNILRSFAAQAELSKGGPKPSRLPFFSSRNIFGNAVVNGDSHPLPFYCHFLEKMHPKVLF